MKIIKQIDPVDICRGAESFLIVGMSLQEWVSLASFLSQGVPDSIPEELDVFKANKVIRRLKDEQKHLAQIQTELEKYTE